MYGFDALNHSIRRRHRPWALHGTESPLDMSVVGFNSIIGVSFGPSSTPLQNALRLANLESLPGRSGTGPCTADVEFDCPDSIEPSAETFWPPHDLAFPINRSPQCRRGCLPRGTDTPTGSRSERRFRPYARWWSCISAFLAIGDRSSDRTFDTNARPSCDPPSSCVRPSFPRRCAGLTKSVSTSGHKLQ